jgi:hypothetical protein
MPWCATHNCPAQSCGGPHIRYRSADGHAEVTALAGAPPPDGYPVLVLADKETAAAPLSQLDAAIAAAREHQRLGDAAYYGGSPDPDTHYLAGILDMLIAFGAVLQEEAS